MNVADTKPDGGVLIDRGGERLRLLPERALWWDAQQTLVVADLHLGKDQVFRQRGVAIPEGPLNRDLDRLDALLAAWPVRRLLVLGDLVHAPPRADEAWTAVVAAWRERHANVDFEVILGNHDRGRLPAGWRMTARSAPRIEHGLAFAHEQHELVGIDGYGLSGHLHPAVKLRDAGAHLRLPAFWCDGTGLVLPAFGAFTGTALAPAKPDDTVWVIAGDQIVEARPTRGRSGLAQLSAPPAAER